MQQTIYQNDRPNIDDVDRDILLKCLQNPNALRDMPIREQRYEKRILTHDQVVDIVTRLALMPIPNSHGRIDGFDEGGKQIAAVGTCGSILAVFSSEGSACVDIPASFESRVAYFV